MEQGVVRMLDGMIETTDDPEIQGTIGDGRAERTRRYATEHMEIAA